MRIRDWSSDVCSSDLVVRSGRSYRGVRARDVGNGLFVINEPVRNVRISEVRVAGGYRVIENTAAPDLVAAGIAGLHVRGARASDLERSFARIQIGRAACRERGWQSV